MKLKLTFWGDWRQWLIRYEMVVNSSWTEDSYKKNLVTPCQMAFMDGPFLKLNVPSIGRNRKTTNIHLNTVTIAAVKKSGNRPRDEFKHSVYIRTVSS